MPDVLIDNPQEWLSADHTVTVHGDEVEPITANRHGDFQYREDGEVYEANINDFFVEVT